jgi:hypothetical protein
VSDEQIRMLTFPEYERMMKALRLRMVDEEYARHEQAYLNFLAQGKKRSGRYLKPIYNTFKKFFDYEKWLEKANNKQSPKTTSHSKKFEGIGALLKKGEK